MTLFTITHLKSVAIFVSPTATIQGSAGLEILMGNDSMKELSKNPMIGLFRDLLPRDKQARKRLTLLTIKGMISMSRKNVFTQCG